MKKRISVLGASGSVGVQALDVAKKCGYAVDLISVNKNIKAAEQYCRELSVPMVCVNDEMLAGELRVSLADTSTKVFSSSEGLKEAILSAGSDVYVNSIIGEAGLVPTLTVIETGKRLALANKESLVIAGNIVMKRAKESKCEILPVDSEHSAIFQSLRSGKAREIKKILLTASGGPFYGKTKAELKEVTLADTLAHPTWKMGKKITVDSATLMNKGFEIIEAVHLFDTPPENIEVLVHRESIMHSAVEFVDNTVIAELSVPDMRMCVQYAVDYPDRKSSPSEELDLFSVGKLTFSKPDYEAFPLLRLAREAIGEGGAMPAVLNASDEVAVEAFLAEKLSFLGISDAVSRVYEKMSWAKNEKTLEGIILADREARRIARECINSI